MSKANPDIVAGAWVVKGTLVPADGLVENAEDGFTPEEIATEIYPPGDRSGGATHHRLCPSVRVSCLCTTRLREASR
jgi:hypothetical protein